MSEQLQKEVEMLRNQLMATQQKIKAAMDGVHQLTEGNITLRATLTLMEDQCRILSVKAQQTAVENDRLKRVVGALDALTASKLTPEQQEAALKEVEAAKAQLHAEAVAKNAEATEKAAQAAAQEMAEKVAKIEQDKKDAAKA